ncbi:MAG TPA: zinc-binding alcohol dehydrogenase family protein, partial [Planctomycetaceae bacterium]|nr:zinc-binding alcohol dehydrogenase family protein [Planctomycetaceae bacterium]
EALVEIYAAALNPADRFQIDGRYPGGPRFPFTCGRDAAGVVVESDAAGRVAVGARVLVLQSRARDLARGTLCERQWLPADALVPVPPGWSFHEAAAAPLVFQTAWQGLTDRGLPTRDQAVVVTGAGGGVGIAAVQLALGLGTQVVALTRSADKAARLRGLGVRHVFSPTDANLQQCVCDALGRKGVDVVVDTVGGPLLATAVHLLGSGGRVAVIGVLRGVEGVIPIPSLMFKRALIQGILVSDLSPSAAMAQWEDIVRILSESGQRPVIDRVYPLENYQQAFDRLASSPFGKVVMEIQ